MEKFEEDMMLFLERLKASLKASERAKLQLLSSRLVHLNSQRLVKINHSILELLCASHLIVSGYAVDVEKIVNSLSCDVYAKKGMGTLIVEIETGFVPPEHALDLLTYCKARVTSKIVRYSQHATKFALAAPPHYVMWLHNALLKPPRDRTAKDVREIKTLCDKYYSNPPIMLEDIRNARLHTVYVLNVDKAEVFETDPLDYSLRTERMTY